jgi:uncharacterized membrane protein YgdD (TMEM256/DUF423 family)
MSPSSSRKVFIGAALLAFAVALGAMGAHALEKTLSAKHLTTFKTGVNYHFLHAFGILFVGIIERVFSKKLNVVFYLFLTGIVLFSFNCYIYAITGIKGFAMIVPLGGVAYIFGWILLSSRFLKVEDFS